jgi:hypothetical protein
MPEGFYYCEEGHGICSECQVETPAQVARRLAENLGEAIAALGFTESYFAEERDKLVEAFEEDEQEDFILEWLTYDELSSAACPFCQLDAISDSDLVAYLKIEADKNHAELLAEIKERFTTHSAFMEYLRRN